MANSKIDVKTKTSNVKNKKTNEQDAELASLKEQKKEAEKKAKKNRKEAEDLAKKKEDEKKAAEKAKQEALEKEQTKQKEQITLAASAAINTIGKNKSLKSTIITLVIGVVIGFIIATLIGTFTINEEKETINTQEISQSIMTHTDVDFENAILGEAKEHQELIVMENPLEISTTITRSGLGNLAVFSKVKDITYHGKGIYTVDMSKIDKEHITVDNGAKTVKVKIPHTILQEVILDVDDIEFEDTENGLLAFGDLSLTAEQQNQVEVAVKKSMTDALNNDELFEKADEFAKLKTWQIFQPLISSVSNEYIVEVVVE